MGRLRFPVVLLRLAEEAAGELALKLPSGTYTIHATFQGKPTFLNHDTAALGLLNVWTGTVSSALQAA